MPKKKNLPELSKAEIGVMRILWQRGPTSVRDVRDTLSEEKDLAYTTVLTMLQRLEEKGHVKKERKGRAYLYEPTTTFSATARHMVSEFVDRLFDGSIEPLVIHLAETKKLTKKDLEELRRVIRKLSR